MDWRDKAACLTVDPELSSPWGTPARRRSDREGEDRLRHLHSHGDLSAVRPGDQPGLRRVGRSLRRRAPRSEASRRTRTPRLLNLHESGLRRGLRPLSSALRAAGQRSSQRRGMSMTTSVPSPIASVPLDGAAQLPLDEGADDLCAEALTDPPLGETETGVAHGDAEVLLGPGGVDGDDALLPARPCSTAFVTTSVSARARGVAYSLGSTPNRPVDCVRARVFGRRGNLGHELEHPVEDLVEIDLLREALSQGVVNDRDRIDATHRLREGITGLVGVGAARLDTQERRHGLEVVLHTMVDLADRRVLGDELLLLMPQLRHIATEHDRAMRVPWSFNGIARNDTVTPRASMSVRQERGRSPRPAGIHRPAARAGRAEW